VGGLTSTQGGSTENYGFFSGPTGAPVMLGGDAVPGLPIVLDTSGTFSFDYRVSELGNSHIIEVLMDTGTTDDGAMVKDGEGLKVAGALVREADPVPLAAGGLPGENWDNFDYTGVNEAGDYFFSGDTDAASSNDEFICKNGVIIYREGFPIDGEVVSGSMEGAYMNADGDIGYIWDINGGSDEAMFLNDRLILQDGDEVDYTGDGVIDAGAVISQFTGISSLTLSDRDHTGRVNMYFVADVDTAGTSSTSDDFEGFFCIGVDMEPTAIGLSALHAAPVPQTRDVQVSWSTSYEVSHDGFHVYRSLQPSSGYECVTVDLIRERPYVFTDSNLRANTTYFYKVGAVDVAGHEDLYGPVQVTTPKWALRSVLFAARPNPFSNRTDIHFTLSNRSPVRLDVFDVGGRLVRTLVDEPRDAGEHRASWDGRSATGAPVSAGVYFYRLNTDDLSETRKIVRTELN
ncbi:MAG TPA: FlgD immunoglobulin-like domain containing protein, partial [bacterium]|nr:FlgD immunoglobulin-like domain containing protein [bacterium]